MRQIEEPAVLHGSHKGSEFSPLEYKAMTTGEVSFCTCKRSNKKPNCDGTHKTLAT